MSLEPEMCLFTHFIFIFDMFTNDYFAYGCLDLK